LKKVEWNIDMNEHEIEKSSTTEGLPVSPSLGIALESAHVHKHVALVDKRVAFISLICVGLAGIATVVAQGLTLLIGLVTNIAFYGRISTQFSSPANNTLGFWVIGIPVVGSVIVGLMARYGSKAIRGHGIPEAMEQILLNESKIPARMIFLKPISAAIAIGTGGPFGAEGPIIATGGAVGSFVGQLFKTNANETKTLLAAGAASGMTAIFGSPVAAVLLAIELLLFEFKPRSIIPVAIATTVAAVLRVSLLGADPAFSMQTIQPAGAFALLAYLVEGLVLGVFSVFLTKAVYGIEDAFERLPIHWMWWPSLGGLIVGIIGLLSPHTLGVGYDNIDKILSGSFIGTSLIVFCVLKFISWAVALGSGTSGGTLAPIFTIGGGAGAAFGAFFSGLFPMLQIDIRTAALVGMAATFAGASRALLTSVIFAFETTRQPNALIPLLGACSVSYLVSALLMRNTIMTEKLVRRGHHVPTEYTALHPVSSK
jgi:CIC family chloride channel protein